MKSRYANTNNKAVEEIHRAVIDMIDCNIMYILLALNEEFHFGPKMISRLMNKAEQISIKYDDIFRDCGREEHDRRMLGVVIPPIEYHSFMYRTLGDKMGDAIAEKYFYENNLKETVKEARRAERKTCAKINDCTVAKATELQNKMKQMKEYQNENRR